jgi:hypothetical protein
VGIRQSWISLPMYSRYAKIDNNKSGKSDSSAVMSITVTPTPQPYSLSHPNQIILTWQLNPHDGYQLYTESVSWGSADGSQSGQTGATSPWTLQTTPGMQYNFSVFAEWIIPNPSLHGIPGPPLDETVDNGYCSTFAATNISSLRQLLQYSGVDTTHISVRSLLQPGQNLRAFMNL